METFILNNKEEGRREVPTHKSLQGRGDALVEREARKAPQGN